MKNLILILAVIFCSCKKHNEDPISKTGVLHIEYSAAAPTFPNTYKSKVMVYFKDKSPITVYSNIDKVNTISKDIIIQGGQHVMIDGSVIDSTGNCTCRTINPTMTLKFNGKNIDVTTTNHVAQYSGTLEFIN